MAEIEIGVMARQCLDRRISDQSTLRREIEAWLRTEEEPDSGAEGVATPGRPGKKGKGPAPRHLCRMWSPTHHGQHQVRDLRREARGKQAAVPAEGQAKGRSARDSGLRPDQDFLTTAPARDDGSVARGRGKPGRFACQRTQGPGGRKTPGIARIWAIRPDRVGTSPTKVGVYLPQLNRPLQWER